MRARYYSPELRRFVNADVLMGDINNSPTLNRYAYANGNPVSNVDPFGLSADNSRGNTNNDIFNNIKEFSLGFLDTGKKGLQTIFEIICGFEFQAGYGTGLRGAVDFLGETVTLGAKVDLLTIKLGSDYFDIGQEALSGGTWDLSFVEGFEIGKQEGYFESYITGEIEQYDSKYPELSFDIVGVDFYLLVGVHAEASYNFQKVFNKIINIWN